MEEERGSWVAWFFHEKLGPTTNDVVRERTALEAALAAWGKFRSEPHLGGSSVVKSIWDRDEPQGEPQPSRRQARRQKKKQGPTITKHLGPDEDEPDAEEVARPHLTLIKGDRTD